MLLTFSGSHGPPWEPIPWLPRQDRYAFPRWSGGNEEKTTNPHPALSQAPALIVIHKSKITVLQS